MKDKILKDKKFLKEIAIILIVGFIINALCFMMPLVVHAESSEASVLPYIPNSYENSLTRAELFEITSILTSAGYTLGDNIIVFRELQYSWYDYSTYIQSPTYTIFDLTNTQNQAVYFGSTYENFELDVASKYINYGGSNFGYCYTLQKRTLGNLHNGYDVRQTSASTLTLFGDATPVTVQNALFSGSYIPNYPVYCSAVFTDSNGNQILSNVYTAPPTTDKFHPSPFTPNPNPNTPPTAPTITVPSIDSSQSLIDNIKALFNWLGETIKSLLAWVIQNILYFFNNLLDNLKSFIDAVIQAINNGFSNVYTNIQNFFSPAINFLMGAGQAVIDFINNLNQLDFHAYIKQRVSDLVSGIQNLVDSVISIKNFLTGTQGFFETYGVIWNQETWEESLDDSPWLTAVTDNTTTMSQFINGTLNVAEPQELTFTMDFRNAYYNFGLVTWDLSWYQPYKQPVRLAFLSICVLNALVYFFDEAPNFFSGGGSNKKGDK